MLPSPRLGGGAPSCCQKLPSTRSGTLSFLFEAAFCASAFAGVLVLRVWATGGMLSSDSELEFDRKSKDLLPDFWPLTGRCLGVNELGGLLPAAPAPFVDACVTECEIKDDGDDCDRRIPPRGEARGERSTDPADPNERRGDH
jgi:hypothetical protein